MLFRFHGIEPSKKSKEKIQRKVRDEMAARKAATSEQPAGTLNQLKHAQVAPFTAQGLSAVPVRACRMSRVLQGWSDATSSGLPLPL